MQRTRLILPVLLLLAAVAGNAQADLDGFLAGLNNQAYAQPDDYGVRLSIQFGVPLPQVHTLIRSVASPADAFMCLQLGRMTNIPPHQVMQVYNSNRGRGWGVIAKDLGIKPGSDAFHALKRGDFALTGNTGPTIGYPGAEEKGQGHGKDKGKGKGHNK